MARGARISHNLSVVLNAMFYAYFILVEEFAKGLYTVVTMVVCPVY